MANELYRKYYRRIAGEGILKSFFLSLAVGSVVLTLIELISWIVGFKAGLWIGFLALAAVIAALMPLFYFKKYRPTAKTIARRVDALGLEERMITMTELENDPSYIALLQREDTKKALQGVDRSLLKIAVSTSFIVALCVCATFGLGSVTTEVLHVAGVIPSVVGIVENAVSNHVFTVSYGVLEGDGIIVRYTEDLSDETPFEGPVSLKEGEDAPAVYALPDTEENWVFVRWSDGVLSPYRKDLAVSGNINVNAVFAQLSDIDVPDPQIPSPSDGGPGEEGEDAYGDDQSQPPDSGENGSGDGQGDEGGGSRNDANQQIYDGDHYYGDDYNNAVDEANGRLDSDDSLDDDRKGWIDDYFGSIEKGGNG